MTDSEDTFMVAGVAGIGCLWIVLALLVNGACIVGTIFLVIWALRFMGIGI